ncbi:nitroreductase family protein, partial [Candidatus Bipolaricaulota bacterium]|nr:nitroreductase family protein [Candidatus Bipolaricaulota bacterium]
YTVLEVDDAEKKRNLARTCGHAFIADAPLVLIFLADLQRWVDLFEADDVPGTCAQAGEPYRKPDFPELLMACCDALVAAQNSVIAAESLGVGSCYIGDILGHAREHRKLFDLPPFAFPIAMVCYGNPPAGFKPLRSERFEPRFIHHRDGYRRFSREELHEMLTEIEAKFAAVLKRKKMSLAEMTYRGFLGSASAQERRRSVEELLKGWQLQR